MQASTDRLFGHPADRAGKPDVGSPSRESAPSGLGPAVAAGRTSDVYAYGFGAVVKVPRSQVPSHWAAREARFARAVHDLGAPTPAVLDVVEVEGRTAIVFERVHGRSMWELILEQPEDAAAFGRQLADIHRRLMSVGLPQDVAGLVDRMVSKIDDADQLTDAERVEARGALERLPRGAALLHGDLHPGNVLMSSEGPMVIDWFDATIGHPVADIVRSSLLIRPLVGAAARPHLPGASEQLLDQLHRSYVDAMSDLLLRELQELPDWEAVVVASRLAEGAEADESLLVDMWRHRDAHATSPLMRCLSTQ